MTIKLIRKLNSRQRREALLQASRPEYKTRESLEDYVKEQIRNTMKKQERRIYDQLTSEESTIYFHNREDAKNYVRRVLEGEETLTSTFVNAVSLSLYVSIERFYPFNKNLSDNEYLELYEMTTGQNSSNKKIEDIKIALDVEYHLEVLFPASNYSKGR